MPDSLIQKEQEYFFRTYKRLSLDIVRGDGCFLFDRQGKRYVDFFGGLAVNALGYRHPALNEAIRRQIDLYSHLSNFFVQEPQILLAEKLLAVSGLKRLFLTNSGTEAIEGALKLARKWGKAKGKTDLFGLSNSFHGRTMGALSLTERAKYREGYDPFLPNIRHIRFNDVQDLRANVGPNTIGVFLEFILGGGLPLGAFLGTEKVSDVFTYGVHGTTFGGNPVACAAGVAVLNEIVDRGLMKVASERGEQLWGLFTKLGGEFPDRIRDVRGFGCMMGIDLHK